VTVLFHAHGAVATEKEKDCTDLLEYHRRGSVSTDLGGRRPGGISGRSGKNARRCGDHSPRIKAVWLKALEKDQERGPRAAWSFFLAVKGDAPHELTPSSCLEPSGNKRDHSCERTYLDRIAKLKGLQPGKPTPWKEAFDASWDWREQHPLQTDEPSPCFRLR